MIAMVLFAFSVAGLLVSGALAAIQMRNHAKLSRRIEIVAPSVPKNETKSVDSYSRITALINWVVGKAVWPRPRDLKQLTAISLACAAIVTTAIGLKWHLPKLILLVIAVTVLCGALRTIAVLDQRSVSNIFMTAFPNSLDMMVRNLRMGLPLDSSIMRVASQAAQPVGPIFDEIGDWMRIGLPLAEAVYLVSQRIRIKEFEFFAAALVIQSKSGGNFIEVSENLATVIRDRQIAHLKSIAAASHARITARILVAIPLGITTGFVLFQPGYFKPLLNNTTGYGLIAYAVGSFIVGIWFIKKYLNHFLNT